MKIKLCDEFYYRVKEKDSIENVSSKFNTDKTNIVRNNSNIELYAGEYVYIKQNEYITHIVKPAENLSDIAKKYNVEYQKLKTDNDLNYDKLFIGQKIKIFKK